MATQHTSFIQPLFLISHYQILLNVIQPFKTAATARKVLLTLCKNCIVFVFVCAHACAVSRVNHDPRTVLPSWVRQISALE